MDVVTSWKLNHGGRHFWLRNCVMEMWRGIRSVWNANERMRPLRRETKVGAKGVTGSQETKWTEGEFGTNFRWKRWFKGRDECFRGRRRMKYLREGDHKMGKKRIEDSNGNQWLVHWSVGTECSNLGWLETIYGGVVTLISSSMQVWTVRDDAIGDVQCIQCR